MVIMAFRPSIQPYPEPMLKPALTHVLDIIFPPQCLNCDELVPTHGTLCQPCWQQISFISPPFCDACGLPFEYAMGKGTLCGECLHTLPAYTHARSAIIYDEHSRGLILKLKYADQTHLASVYGPWLARCGKELLADTELMIPVPLHYWRFITRRYNQSALLADSLHAQTGLPVIADALLRKRPTKPQTGLTKKQRRENVRGAFHVNPRWKDTITGKRIMLIDDVMTTSATIHQCSKALLAGGAARVYVLTLARAANGY
jgi:ComF family protein